MIKEDKDYVSFATAKKLKEKNFMELCDSLYSTAFLHNGQEIDEDDEFELRCDGRENEIEYVEGGTVFYHPFYNARYGADGKEVARPTLYQAMNWFRNNHNMHIMIMCFGKSKWGYGISEVNSSETPKIELEMINDYQKTYEEACEAAINFCCNRI